MSTGSDRPGTAVATPAPGRRVYSDGVVHTHNIFAQTPTVPAPEKGQGILSYVALAYGDTTGPLTQVKVDHWEPGKPETRGSFVKHDHGGEQPMGEFFLVLEGAATFSFNVPGGPETEVTLGAGDGLYFPPGVRHAGWNPGLLTATVLVIGVREAAHPCDGDRKGTNIPMFV